VPFLFPVLPDPARLALFVGATLVLLLVPGPAVLYIVTRSMSQGRRSGLLSVVGIELGNAVHCLAAALGLAALLASSPLAFSAVKYLGAAYLIWLGLRRLLSREEGGLASQAARPADPSAAVLRQAFTVAVLNPKTALFFLAFLPQFASPARGLVTVQMLLLGATFVGLAFVTDTCYAFVASGLGTWLRSHPGFARSERYLTAAVYIGLGALSAFAAPPVTAAG